MIQDGSSTPACPDCASTSTLIGPIHAYRYAGNLDQVYGEDGRVVFLDAVFVK